MRLLSLFLSFIIVLAALCSCARLRQKINPPIENAGEIVTAAPRTDVAESDTADTESESVDTEAVEREDPLGSCGTLDGRTVVVTAFTSDAGNAWGDGAEAQVTKDQMLEYLGIACEWISERAMEYDIKSEFIYDWSLHSDLMHICNFSRYDMLVDDMSLYDRMVASITNNIPIEMLLQKYDADDILFLFFLNTPFENEMRPVSLTHLDSPDVTVEYATVPVRANGQVTSPSTLAHELLHFFGAYDLYETEDNPIPAEYIAELAATGSDDIMRVVQGGPEITSTFSAVDAYYVGLIDSCPELEEWQLPQAERFIYK